MRSALVVQCSPCRCAISAAASQIVSGRRVRGGFELRHSVNRWLSCNKSSGMPSFHRTCPTVLLTDPSSHARLPEAHPGTEARCRPSHYRLSDDPQLRTGARKNCTIDDAALTWACPPPDV